MVRTSRRKGIVAVVLGLSLGLSGCIGTSDDRLLMQQAYLSPSSPGNLTRPGSASLQTSGVQAAPAGNVARASFGGAQPMPGVTDEPVFEHKLGMPTPMGMSQPMGMMMAQSGPAMPTELNKSAHPPHRVAAPDILYIEALRLIPKGPYKLEPMEVLQIEVLDTLPKQDIKGLYMISPEGKVNLGHTYGSIQIGGLTVELAQVAIRNHLAPIIKGAPSVNIALVQMRGMQNVKGEHLVRPDGTISLGMYGSVFVAGMTLGQVKCTVENHLGAYLVNPQISVDVFAYNSRKIYIVADGAGYGQQVIALPATGNETVLDAISRVQGLPAVASLKKIWVARPGPVGNPCSTVLPVDWKAITQAGRTETNYQLLPGDRIYIDSDCLIKTYNWIDKMVAPAERVLGVLFLGSSTFQSFRNQNNNGLLIAR